MLSMYMVTHKMLILYQKEDILYLWEMEITRVIICEIIQGKTLPTKMLIFVRIDGILFDMEK